MVKFDVSKLILIGFMVIVPIIILLQVNSFNLERRIAPPPDFDHKEQLPDNLNIMLEIAEKLSEAHPFLRVDLYNKQGKVYFGELTFFPAGGLGQFTEDKMDYKFGEWLKLPK